MKSNWGTGIVVAFALFMAFILYFVYQVQSDPKYDNELVVEEYYKKDMKYGQEIAMLQNSANLPAQPVIEKTRNGVKISFPAAVANTNGTVSFYRPSAKKLDFTLPIALSGGAMLIPDSHLAGGLWDITLQWQTAGKPYMIKKQLYY